MYILGISCFYHDSAACLIKDGEIIAAAQEERFSRIKNDEAFPVCAIKFCLEKAGIELSQVDDVVYYEKPFITFERIIETHLRYAPKGYKSFLKLLPVWLKEKLICERVITKELKKNFGHKIKELKYSTHHLSHAASSFFPSPYDDAVILCLDGIGEWATTSCWRGQKSSIKPLWEIQFPNSLGLLYTSFTTYLGFKANCDEYKIMGLAPYGDPKYKDLILEKLIDVKEDGSFNLNLKYFDFMVGLQMYNKKFEELFERPARIPESKVEMFHMDMAASIQKVIEHVLLKMTKYLYKEHGVDTLCLAGGVALNCVANGKILKESGFKNVWIQPAAGDAGGALGASLAYYHIGLGKECSKTIGSDKQKSSLLGPEFSNEEIEKFLTEQNTKFTKFENEDELCSHVASLIENENVIGWFQGKTEFGPRALGSRSIIADPRSEHMQKTLNLKIKFRESFRPFAPIVKEDKVSDFFDFQGKSPYMLLVSPVKEEILINNEEAKNLEGIDKLNAKRSQLPAITHVDNSARLQTVSNESNPRLYKLLDKFETNTGVPVLVNTSFNVRGEPIVNSPKNAFDCFIKTNMDVLVLNNYVILKSENQ